MLNEVMTFAEAAEALGKSRQYLNDMVKSGWLLEGVHYRSAGRVKIILRSVVDEIKNGEFKTKAKELKDFYKDGEKLGLKIKSSNNIQFVRKLILKKEFSKESAYMSNVEDLMQLASVHDIEFPVELLDENYENKVEALLAYACGITAMFR